MCLTCFKLHQKFLKLESHEARNVKELQAGSLREFLEGVRKPCNLFCTTHKTQIACIYCSICCKPKCLICALLDSEHRAGPSTESQQDGNTLVFSLECLYAPESPPQHTHLPVDSNEEGLLAPQDTSHHLLSPAMLPTSGTRDIGGDADPEVSPMSSPEISNEAHFSSSITKRKGGQDTEIPSSPAKFIKTEADDGKWEKWAREPNLEQPGTSSSTGNGSGWMANSAGAVKEADLTEPLENNIPQEVTLISILESSEEDDSDEESMSSSLPDDTSNISYKSHEGDLPVILDDLLPEEFDTRQGSLLFFDLKLLRKIPGAGSEITQLAVIDGSKKFIILIQPLKSLPDMIEKGLIYETGMKPFFSHLRTVHKPILVGFALWSLSFPILFKALDTLGMGREFRETVFGFLDVLPLIKEKIPKAGSYHLKHLASNYLWKQLNELSALEAAEAVKDLCTVLEIDPVQEPSWVDLIKKLKSSNDCAEHPYTNNQKGKLVMAGQNPSETPPPSLVCVLCLQDDNDVDRLGEKLKKGSFCVHHYCLIFANKLKRKGKKRQGFHGHLFADIRKEVERAAKQVCCVCGEYGAATSCGDIGNCQRTFHFPCGQKHGFISQYFDPYRAFCYQHGPTQNLPSGKEVMGEASCVICFSSLETYASYDVLQAPCCYRWLHRACVQKYAFSAGLFCFKCPFCNNQDTFPDEMKRMGINIPRRKPSWETEPNAFSDLCLQEPSCNVEICQCPDGRDHFRVRSKWALVLCEECGVKGTHRLCSSLNEESPWLCQECMETLCRQIEAATPSDQVDVGMASTSEACRHALKRTLPPE
ncbi:PHD finger protein 7 isoform C [Alligator mississippiensis]|uniref:PHD finger protein 7 isoform C n=1 Tax=Alligator mississippiensis TaxID=8496 RepID=A0A151MAM7_ALLMI|nr:PHD finger protein 7 isoform C [Alligator mississippiensis]